MSSHSLTRTEPNSRPLSHQSTIYLLRPYSEIIRLHVIADVLSDQNNRLCFSFFFSPAGRKREI